MKYLDYKISTPHGIQPPTSWFYLTKKINLKTVIYDWIVVDVYGICIYSNLKQEKNYYFNSNSYDQKYFFQILQKEIFKYPFIKKDESSMDLKHFVIMAVLHV